MTIKKKPFVNYTLDEDKQNKGFIVISMKLNIDEQAQLIKDKQKIHQAKDGTAIKQLWKIGSKVVHDEKMAEYINILIGNKRKNKRVGVADFE